MADNKLTIFGVMGGDVFSLNCHFLISDFNSFLELYKAVADDPLTSNMEDLFE
jgi:hypothetical protein